MVTNEEKKQYSAEFVNKLSKNIEIELFNSTNGKKYFTHGRSLILNLNREAKLYKNIFEGVITPARFVNMTTEELASDELSLWRKEFKQKDIELLTRDAYASPLMIKKTHKGEELIGDYSIDDNDPSKDKKNEATTSEDNRLTSPKLRSSLDNDSMSSASTSQANEELNLENDQHLDHLEGNIENLDCKKNLLLGHQPKRICIMPDVNFKKMLHEISFEPSSEDESVNEDTISHKPNWTGSIHVNVEGIDKFNANIFVVSGKVNLKVSGKKIG